ncbi:ABC transporter permease subunit [Roseicyclus sp. F158]|uniref:ABC transporter permease subunit n=1 Tax=Tropicimonas omnivorans TaxID=3075590 RepID=A0ABU3DEY7_9RHOB|nr:ABC transporter permease subunit [Roseicyclus sp. F158]MDT0682283.1 ABC transporter permease subunit [Roseicyclus sp. F158]
MSAIPDQPARDKFQLSQLIYDTRYRSLTIQIFAFMLLAIALFWLGRNTVINLAALGKDFDFGFLGQRAGYDINQSLIPYSSASSHGRAALVGILNTMLVAALGCTLALVVGTIAGVLRLSNNWLVAKIMTVYVEMFRNVPVLLWIIAFFAILNESTPSPRDFGENGDASLLFGSIAVTNRGVYIPRPTPLDGAGWAVWALVAIVVVSIAAIIVYRGYAKRQQQTTGRILPVFRVSLALFFAPAIIAFFLLGMPLSLDYPELGGFNFQGGIMMRNSLIALWLALSLYTGAFIAEIVRGGILSVSKGQTEAAFALGLRPSRTMNLVILPQALRVIIPPLISQFLNLTKNSSLAIAVGYMDVRSTLGGITINQTGRELEGMLLLGLFYLVLSLVISASMNFYNSTIKLKER